MKTNDPLGDLIDNLIDVYVDKKTPKGVTKQLEPIINGLVESGYRLCINNGAGAGQTVFHLHCHLLSGREMRWPPG